MIFGGKKKHFFYSFTIRVRAGVVVRVSFGSGLVIG